MSPRGKDEDHFLTLAIRTMGIDIIGPLPLGKRQVRFLLVARNGSK